MASVNDEAVIKEWIQFKEVHGKAYTETEEDEKRLKIYLDNKEKVEQHNILYEKGEVSYKMGINKFSDMLPSELAGMKGLNSLKK